jgi:hypothetical protein
MKNEGVVMGEVEIEKEEIKDLFGMYSNRCPCCQVISLSTFETPEQSGFYCGNPFCKVEKVVLGGTDNDPEVWTS